MNEHPQDELREPTVVSCLKALSEGGYTHNLMSAESARIRCADCDVDYPASEAVIDHERRIEGETNPGDAAIILAVSHKERDCKGAMVLGYGAASSRADGEVLEALQY